MPRPYHNGKRRKRNAGRDSIRRVRGPGKFEGETALTLYAYNLVLEGMDDECLSDGCGGTSYSKIPGPFNPAAANRFEPVASEFECDGRLTHSERRDLRRYAGVILLERSDGFVNAFFFKSSEKFENAWESLALDFEEVD